MNLFANTLNEIFEKELFHINTTNKMWTQAACIRK